MMVYKNCFQIVVPANVAEKFEKKIRPPTNYGVKSTFHAKKSKPKILLLAHFLQKFKETQSITWFPQQIIAIIFSGLFSATFFPNFQFYGRQFFSATDIF
jgi:alkylated DNA repair dioxygenase AlkB